MSFGFALSNASLSAVLDETSVVPYRVDSGHWPLTTITTSTGTYIQWLNRPVNSAAAETAPMVLIRPDAYDFYVGGFAGGVDYDPGGPFFMATGQTGFYWQVYAPGGPPIVDPTSWGAELYGPAGQVLYSSRRRHVRLRQVIEITPAMLVDDEVYVPLSGYTSMPWILANNLPMTVAGIGEFSEFYPGLMAKVHAGNTGITFCWRDMADNQTPSVHGPHGFRKLTASMGFDALNQFFFAGNYYLSLYVNEEI